MSADELKNASEKQLLGEIIERQKANKELLDDMKLGLNKLRDEVQDLKISRAEQRGTGKALSWIAMVISSLTALWAVIKGGN